MPVSPLATNERSSSGTLEASISPRRVRSSSGSTPSASRLTSLASHDGLQPVDRHRKDDRGVLLGGDLGEGLQVAEMDGDGLPLQGLGSVGELLAGLELARGVDDLGALLAL